MDRSFYAVFEDCPTVWCLRASELLLPHSLYCHIHTQLEEPTLSKLYRTSKPLGVFFEYQLKQGHGAPLSAEEVQILLAEVSLAAAEGEK